MSIVLDIGKPDVSNVMYLLRLIYFFRNFTTSGVDSIDFIKYTLVNNVRKMP